ncbi:hypothetical protein C8Q74DRAFT_1320278 [Fomes fomentarius]|nr:hypothetical protein C8Q74DRAFT_1320278 [Fomes fomentarius]
MVVDSSDVLEDMRINVCEESTDKVVWYKERFLTDDEILEHIVDNATSTLLWTVHRPKRGWYIRLRTPSFPPGVFIPLLPVPQTSPYHADAALSFACRTNLPPSGPASEGRPPALTTHSTDSEVTLTEGSGREQHSYPPTPPTGPVVVVHPPSPRSVHAKLKSVSLSPPRALRRLSQPLLQSAITNFILTPHSQPHVPEPTQAVSIFTRLMAAIKNHAPSHSYSFTLSPVPGALTPAKGFVPIAPAPAGQEGTDPLTPLPLLTFHDRTPVFTAYRTSGLLEMDEQLCRNLGVEPSFYIAAALTYLEFLEDRESYLAAASD